MRYPYVIICHKEVSTEAGKLARRHTTFPLLLSHNSGAPTSYNQSCVVRHTAENERTVTTGFATHVPAQCVVLRKHHNNFCLLYLLSGVSSSSSFSVDWLFFCRCMSCPLLWTTNVRNASCWNAPTDLSTSKGISRWRYESVMVEEDRSLGSY